MKTVIFIESFEINYLKTLKAFIRKFAPHVISGLMAVPLVDWEKTT